MALIRCIYASTSSVTTGEPDCQRMLADARHNNARYDITSLLLAVESNFVQVLEGEADDVDELFLHIAGDPRHTAIQEIIRETIAARCFGSWDLGFVRLDRQAVDQCLASSELWTGVDCLQQLGPEQALLLLKTFADQNQPHG